MLYNIISSPNGGSSFKMIHKTLTSDYDNVLILLSEIPVNLISKRIRSYEENTNNVNPDKITMRRISLPTNYDEIEYIIESNNGSDDKIDCIAIDYMDRDDNMLEKFSKLSVENDVDIIIITKYSFHKIRSIDEAIENYVKEKDNVSNILIFNDSSGGEITRKVFEDGVISNFDINEFIKEEDVK